MWPMTGFVQDLRHSFRAHFKSPGVTATAVVALGASIAASTVTVSVVQTVLLRSLPFKQPDRLVRISNDNPGLRSENIGFSVPELDDLRLTGLFEQVCAFWPTNANLTGAERPARLEVLVVSPNYFSMLGVSPRMGRVFGPEDVVPGIAEAAVISDGLWRRSFGGDPHVLGRTLRLDNDLYTIVGVLPPGFRHPGRTGSDDVELWATSGFSGPPLPPPVRKIRLLPGMVGRLKPSINYSQAQAGLNGLASRWERDFPNEYPREAKWAVDIQPLQETLVGSVRPLLLALTGAVFLVVLLTSINVANLLLARASRLHRQFAIQLALGSPRYRLVLQVLVDSVSLSLVAGVLGTGMAFLILHFVPLFLPEGVPRLNEIEAVWYVTIAGLLISLFVGVLSALVPAIHALHTNISAALREGTQGAGQSSSANRLRGGLIMFELTMGVVLMVGGGLLVRTFWRLAEKSPGFTSSQVVAADIHLPEPNDEKTDAYKSSENQQRFARELMRRLNSLPGVSLAGIITTAPIRGHSELAAFTVEGEAPSLQPTGESISVSPDYFKVMQIPLSHGRVFNENDEWGKQEVAVVDKSTAAHFWPNQDAVGKRLRMRPDATVPWFALPWMTVVGIVGDSAQDGLDVEGVPHIYTSIYQHPRKAMTLVIRTSLPATSSGPGIRREVEAIDPGVPVFHIQSMNEVISDSLATRRFAAALVGGFAVFALVLAITGIYGLLDLIVNQSLREVGIRMALGAEPSNITRLFLAKGTYPAMVGILLGIGFAALAGRGISSLLYGVSSADPAVFLAAAVLFLTVSISASYIPARRAARVDPFSALRED